jgi:hypothetical protein
MILKQVTDSSTDLIIYFIDTVPVIDIELLETDQMIVNESHSSYSWTLPPGGPPTPKR